MLQLATIFVFGGETIAMSLPSGVMSMSISKPSNAFGSIPDINIDKYTDSANSTGSSSTVSSSASEAVDWVSW
jgi:hypothetical protein